MRKLSILFSFAFFSTLVIASCSSPKINYYIYVYDTYDKKQDEHYIYILDGYNAEGEKRRITFHVETPLDEGTFVKVSADVESYTGNGKIIDEENIPKKAKEQMNLH